LYVLTSDSSILSSDCVVDYDGVFYWAGVDRFLMFNGVVREVPNTMNLNYFYEGLNQAERSKVFAFKVPRYGGNMVVLPSRFSHRMLTCRHI